MAILHQPFDREILNIFHFAITGKLFTNTNIILKKELLVIIQYNLHFLWRLFRMGQGPP